MGVRFSQTSLSLFLSLSWAITPYQASWNEVRHVQSYVFPRHKRNHILPRCALEGAYSLLSTIHTRPTDSRSTDNLIAEMCWCESMSSRYPTFFDVRVSAADLCRRRVLRDATTGGRQVGLHIFSTHLFPQCSFSFFLGRFNRLFFVSPSSHLRPDDKSPRQPRHERFFREYITLCVIHNDEACKKIIKHARPGLFCAQLATRVEGQRYFI